MSVSSLANKLAAMLIVAINNISLVVEMLVATSQPTFRQPGFSLTTKILLTIMARPEHVTKERLLLVIMSLCLILTRKRMCKKVHNSRPWEFDNRVILFIQLHISSLEGKLGFGKASDGACGSSTVRFWLDYGGMEDVGERDQQVG